MTPGEQVLLVGQVNVTQNGIATIGGGDGLADATVGYNCLVVVREGGLTYGGTVWVTHPNNPGVFQMVATTRVSSTEGGGSGMTSVLQNELPSAALPAGTPYHTLVGPHSAPPVLRTRFLTMGPGIAASDIDGGNGIALRLANPTPQVYTTVIRPTDVLASVGSLSVKREVVLPGTPPSPLMDSFPVGPVIRLVASAATPTGTLTCGLHGVPTGQMGLEMDVHAFHTGATAADLGTLEVQLWSLARPTAPFRGTVRALVGPSGGNPQKKKRSTGFPVCTRHPPGCRPWCGPLGWATRTPSCRVATG